MVDDPLFASLFLALVAGLPLYTFWNYQSMRWHGATRSLTEKQKDDLAAIFRRRWHIACVLYAICCAPLFFRLFVLAVLS